MRGIRNHRRGGSSLIEFTLVGIPLIFVLLSTFEMARGMWLYHTLAYAARQGTRYAIVHGVNCSMGIPIVSRFPILPPWSKLPPSALIQNR